MNTYNPFPSLHADEAEERGQLEQLLVEFERFAAAQFQLVMSFRNREMGLRQLLAAEADSRREIEKNQCAAAQHLNVAADLLHYDVAPIWAIDGSATVALQLTEIEERSVSPERVSREIPLGEVIRSLRSLEDTMFREPQDGSSAYIGSLMASFLLTKALNGRWPIQEDEKVERRRLTRIARDVLGAVAALEAREKQLARQRWLSALPLPQRTLTITKPLQHEESLERALLQMEIKHERGSQHLLWTATTEIMSLRLLCTSQAEVARRETHTRLVKKISKRVASDRLASRFETWREFAVSSVRRRYQLAVMTRLLASRGRAEARFAFQRWWDWCFAWRIEQSLQAQVTAEVLERLRLVFTETEFRGRATIADHEQAAAWTTIIEAHFSKLDRVRTRDVARRGIRTIFRTLAQNQLMYLQKWHRWWRERSMMRKASWLLRRHDSDHARILLRQWATWASPFLELRNERRSFEVNEGHGRHVVCMIEREAWSRLEIHRREHYDRIMVEHFNEECLRAVKLRLTMVLERLQTKRHLQSCYARWFLFNEMRQRMVLVRALVRTNDFRRLADAYYSWRWLQLSRRTYRRCVTEIITDESVTRAQLLLRREEGVGRVPIAMQEDYMRRHTRRCFLHLSPYAQEIRLTQLEVLGERSRKRNAYACWRTHVAAVQTHRSRLGLASALSESNAKHHGAWRFALWRIFVAPEDEITRIDVSHRKANHAAVIRERRERESLVAEEFAEAQRIMSARRESHASSTTAFRNRRMAEIVAHATCRLRRTAQRRWYTWARQTIIQRSRAAATAALAVASTVIMMRRYFRRWNLRSRRKHLLESGDIERFLNLNQRLLMARYFRRLMPRSVRLARISLAKRRLADARVAAASVPSADEPASAASPSTAAMTSDTQGHARNRLRLPALRR